MNYYCRQCRKEVPFHSVLSDEELLQRLNMGEEVSVFHTAVNEDGTSEEHHMALRRRPEELKERKD